MDLDQPITVTRTITLDASAADVWRQLTDDRELSRWFASPATIDAVPGGIARFGEGAAARRAVVHHVEAGRRLGFTWWDEERPADASSVELVVESISERQVQLTVTETLVPATGGIGARACSWMDVADAWDGRLLALGGALGARMSARCSLLVG